MMISTVFYGGLAILSLVYCHMFKTQLQSMHDYVERQPHTNMTAFEDQVVLRTINYADYCFYGGIFMLGFMVVSVIYWCMFHSKVKNALNAAQSSISSSAESDVKQLLKGNSTTGRTHLWPLVYAVIWFCIIVQPYLWSITFACFSYVCYDFVYNVNIFVHLEAELYNELRDDNLNLLKHANVFFWTNVFSLAALMFQVVLGHIWAIQKSSTNDKR